MTDPSPFLEQTDYWTSITRRGEYPRGMGKWMLHTDQPHWLYGILRDVFLAGKLAAVYSIKTITEAPPEGGAVYLHTGPYTDQNRVRAVAEEIHDIYDRVDLQLTHSMIYKTDLHNTWCETLARPGDRYYALLKRNWLYKWGGVLVVNAVIQALHQALEDPPRHADREFLLIRSMLPEELFVGKARKS
jgi:hypothetical protein